MVSVHSMLGYLYSTALKAFLRSNDISEKDIDLIASRADSIPPSLTAPLLPTLTTGEAQPTLKSWTAVIAAETNITAASNLPITRRPVNERDSTAASPLDSLLLQPPTKVRVCVTLTDLLTITVIPPADGKPRVAPPSSVCGPGTIFIDYAMRYATSNCLQNDYDGTYASQGIVNHAVVDRVLAANDYSARVPALHIATEMFGHHEAQSVIEECLFLGMTDNDTLATITRITAENLVRQYRRLVAKYCLPDQKVDEMFICGPGAQNTEIVNYVEEVLPTEVITKPLDDIGIPGDAKEAVCCAHLGLEMILKYGAKEDGPFEGSHQNPTEGAIVKGRNWDKVREHVLLFSGGEEMPPVQRVLIEKRR
jgi:1,6-anhydro-N-acetylmuramate kinase